MTDIVQIMPGRNKVRLGHIATALAIFAIPLAPLAFTPAQLTHEEARQEVFEAYGGYPPEAYPDIQEARDVTLIGIGCGPDKATIILTGEEDGFPWNCEDIEAHSAE